MSEILTYKQYKEALKTRDWATCDLICDEHIELQVNIVKLETKLALATEALEFYAEDDFKDDSIACTALKGINNETK